MSCVLFIIRVPYENKELSSEDSNDKNLEPLNESVELEKYDSINQEPKTPDMECVSLISSFEVLQNVIISCNIQGCSWQVTNDNLYHQVMFLEEAGQRVDIILNRLTNAGIGIRPKTSVSVVPTSVHIGKIKEDSIHSNSKRSSNYKDDDESNENEPLVSKKTSSREAFIKSVKSKLTVEQVVEAVKTQAQLTFDYVMFTILASVIAGVGLVENNSVVLVASMLVSPLMGPILGVTFGNQIKNHVLRNIGLKTEICGLLTAVIVGFLFGFICGAFGLDGASWNSNQDTWPTSEMTSRGMLRGWWIGVLIALPSGAGVALSVLGGNAGSLVGVAISASLLPPAVNSGMLWAYSIICAIKHPTFEKLNNNTQVINEELGCFPLKNNNYKPIYSCNMAEEAAIMAAVSLLLTVLNILCILITGTLVLKLKEVAPGASSSNATQLFWTNDVKVAREAYQTLKGDKAALTLKDTFLKEWKKAAIPGTEETEDTSQDVPQSPFEFLDLVQELEEDPGFQNVVSRAPRGQQKIHGLSQKLRRQLSEDLTENAEKMAFRPFWTIHTTQRNESPARRRRLETVFEQLEQKQPEQETKPEKKAREFLVTETDKPHLTSVVTVRPPTKETDNYSVTTESGV